MAEQVHLNFDTFIWTHYLLFLIFVSKNYLKHLVIVDTATKEE